MRVATLNCVHSGTTGRYRAGNDSIDFDQNKIIDYTAENTTLCWVPHVCPDVCWPRLMMAVDAPLLGTHSAPGHKTEVGATGERPGAPGVGDWRLETPRQSSV